jgi:hypothetical protein
MMGIAGLALTLVLGISPAYVLILAICPLMMLLMMRSMGHAKAHDDHPSHDDEHDQSEHDRPALPRT